MLWTGVENSQKTMIMLSPHFVVHSSSHISKAGYKFWDDEIAAKNIFH